MKRPSYSVESDDAHAYGSIFSLGPVGPFAARLAILGRFPVQERRFEHFEEAMLWVNHQISLYEHEVEAT